MDQQPLGQAQPTYTQQPIGETEWQYSLFDCFEGEDNLCLKGTFCPCFVYGKVSNRMRNPSLQNYERFNSDCITWYAANFCCSLGLIVQCMKQGELRQQFSIKGSAGEDCLVSFFCHCCSLIRMEKEVINRQQQAGVVQTGYVAPPAGMVAEPKTQ